MEEQIAIRCTAEQRELWERAADLEKRPLAQWARIALDEYAERKLAEAKRSKEKR